MEVVIDGRTQNTSKRARRLILVDGIQYWIRGKQFDLIQRLAMLGWATRDQLVSGPKEELGMVLYRIREETPLKPSYDPKAGKYTLGQDVEIEKPVGSIGGP